MICSICKRSGEEDFFEKHHLKPQRKSEIINVCNQCGDQIHLMFDNNFIRNNLDEVDKIINNEKMKKYINWVKNKPLEKHFAVAKKKRRK